MIKQLTNLLFSIFKRKSTVIYFSPHQDDELLTLGIDVCNTLMSSNKTAHIFLCSDGSKSGIRNVLKNEKKCSLHSGIHKYNLDVPEFIAARDREFMDSCKALGFTPDKIHYFSTRVIDSELSVEVAEKNISAILSQFPKDVIVCTISPFGGDAQHKDHTNLGQAALNLYKKGHIQNLRLFIEPYCVDSCCAAYPNLKLKEIPASNRAKKRLEKAIASYCLWKPEAKRYAIGFHSVTGIFKQFISNPVAYYHDPSDIPT